MKADRVFAVLAVCFFAAVPLLAQQATDRLLARASSSSPDPVTAAPVAVEPRLKPGSCKPLEMQAAKELTFKQRACLYSAQLIAPSTALHGAFIASWGELRNSPHIDHQDLDDFGHRLEAFYARRASQYTAELLAGYLNHEDPRARPVPDHGFWNRTRAAFLSVIAVKNADGSSRPELAPIAGALGSGLTSMGFYRKNNGFGAAMERSGLTYSGYFATALAHEFQPDLNGLASRILHRKNGN